MRARSCLSISAKRRHEMSRRESTRYLLFFTEVNVTNTGAVTSAGKFNRQGRNKALLAGIGPSSLAPRESAIS